MFTPGQWFVFPGREGIFNGCDVVASSSVDDAIVCAMGHDLPEVASNARLIAAAPEMYAVCESLVSVFELPIDQRVATMERALALAKAALAKVAGQS